ncbi:unnamed protein product [Ilex paraguariensis]|uniref:Uncharacterized protein n=1 Tax=Ilex paraguariensis TaxID=185542 RepID=A0ABC8TLC7_9AQUA
MRMQTVPSGLLLVNVKRILSIWLVLKRMVDIVGRAAMRAHLSDHFPRRSSYSFRRQGSSGRIWDNRPELKGGGSHATTYSESTQEPRFDNERFNNLNPSVASASSGPERKVHHSVASAPRSEHKVQRCAFAAILRRCVGSHAS